MNTGLTTLQEKFIELMLDDNFYTNKQMAELLGCDERTIYKMKRNEKVGKEIERLADAGLKININRAYSVLQDILFNPEAADMVKIKALDLYLKTQGKLKDKTETETKLTVSSAEQAEAELDKLLEM
ncbi:phBC6A51 family helix-turn-helix protein [Cytobacillus firmus]|nr:phBC6A51 family helix-turn-helix protein [Cytobacillus firmus]